MASNRRKFLQATATGGIAAVLPSRLLADQPGGVGPLETYVPTRTITRGPKFHWFGYYDKQEFDPASRHVLTNEISFEGRSPTGDDVIGVGYVDTRNDDRYVPIGQSNAWGWQQGCMLQFAGNDGKGVLWNDRQDGKFVCRVHDLETKATRTLDRPIYTLAPDGKHALTADFRRIDNLRPGYGYDGAADPFVNQRAPERSGVWRMNLATGQSELILSLAQAARIPWPGKDTTTAWHYFNHLLVNPSSDRFIVLHRYRPRFDPATLAYEGGFVTRMLTADMDGSNVRVLDPSGFTSHFIWKDAEVVTMFTKPFGQRARFYDFRDGTDEVTPVGHDKMPANGHNTYLGGDFGDWILNDTYPSRTDRRQTVYLYHPASDRRFDLGHFPSPPAYSGQWRCDTHPRSSPDGKTVAIDSAHHGGRQVHLLDIGDLLQKHA